MKRAHHLGELVKLQSRTGEILDGMLFSRGGDVIVLHVHGSLGNFYQNEFVSEFAAAYNSAGIDFLSFNLSARDAVGEGYWSDGSFRYVGGALVSFDSCLDDIGGVVEDVSQTWSRVIIQGHSLGCDRAIHYAVRSGARHGLILLAPCDSYALHCAWLGTETPEQQVERLRARTPGSNGIEWLPEREYGISSGGENYSIPTTPPALLSIIDGAPFRYLRLDADHDYQINGDVIAYLGGRDPLRTFDPKLMMAHLGSRTHSARLVFEADGDHMLTGCAGRVARKVAAMLSGAPA